MKPLHPKAQRGATILVVIILLAVLLLGALALARMTEASTLTAGNTTYRETSLQASEIGLNDAFTRLRALPDADEDTNVGGWYFAQVQPEDANGLPVVDFNAAQQITVGAYTVSYVVERVCSVPAVTDPLRECLVKTTRVLGSQKENSDPLEPPSYRQYRATVRVTGPKNTVVFTQSLLTKG